MKKLLGIMVLSLLLCTNVYAKKIKNGSGPLKLTESDVKTFHIYLTEKLSRDGLNPSFNGKKLPGFHGGSPEKSVYADYFLIQYDNQPYIWAWGSSVNQNPGTTLKVFGGNPADYKIFAKKKKIVWKGAKKKIPKDITLEDLKLIFIELGFL
jgi:hypothetical protein